MAFVGVKILAQNKARKNQVLSLKNETFSHNILPLNTQLLSARFRVKHAFNMLDSDTHLTRFCCGGESNIRGKK